MKYCMHIHQQHTCNHLESITYRAHMYMYMYVSIYKSDFTGSWKEEFSNVNTQLESISNHVHNDIIQLNTTLVSLEGSVICDLYVSRVQYVPLGVHLQSISVHTTIRWSCMHALEGIEFSLLIHCTAKPHLGTLSL